MSYYDSLDSQRSMTFDERRNKAYVQALEKVITSESVVLDLGAGLGILGLQAAKLGAKKVYLVEPEDVICVTQKIVNLNGFDDRVVCLQGKIESIEIPEPVDVIISVFTGNFLLSEDLLPSLFFARDCYLKPNGILLPDAAVMEAAPISAPDFFKDTIGAWSEPHLGIDHSPARSFANQSIYWVREELKSAEYLSDPAALMTLDFYTATATHCQTDVAFSLKQSGQCHGFAGWFKMRLGDDWLSTAPFEPAIHWSVAYLPLDPPLEITAGSELQFQLSRPPRGDWTWQASLPHQRQQHSTFLATPMSINTLLRQSLNYCPKRNVKGDAALYVLTNSDGALSVKTVGEHLTQKYPEQFPELQKAIDFVQNLMDSLSH